jgi:hypothetical protein
MADMVLQKDPQNLGLAAVASAHTSATAGGSGNNVAVTGLTIDRQAYGMPLNGVFDIIWETVLGATNTLTLKGFKVEDSADGSSWATYATLSDPGVVATGPTGGGTVRGITAMPFERHHHRRCWASRSS